MFLSLSTTKSIVLVIYAITLLCSTDAFSVKLQDICGAKSYCRFIFNGAKRVLYGYQANSDNNICMEAKIEECSCYEMLLLQKSWIPDTLPKLDATDVKQLYRRAVKKYHPDLIDNNFQGNKQTPFMFLQKCYSFFTHPSIRLE